MSASAALKMLFELLEDYAPMWYTEEHHNLAVKALAESAEERTQAPPLGCGEETAFARLREFLPTLPCLCGHPISSHSPSGELNVCVESGCGCRHFSTQVAVSDRHSPSHHGTPRS